MKPFLDARAREVAARLAERFAGDPTRVAIELDGEFEAAGASAFAPGTVFLRRPRRPARIVREWRRRHPDGG